MRQATDEGPGPDRGWAWVVALACFSINFIMAGLARTAGVLYVALIDLYGVSRESATTPFSIRVCVRNMTGPLVGLLGQRFGIRPITMIGGVVAGLGGILCYLAPDIFWITIFWGVIHGVGFGLSTVLHMMSINQYFDKYRATALGIGFSGDCFGTFAFPVILETLLYHYDVRGTFLILGAIVLNVIPAAMLLKKPVWLKTIDEMESEKLKIEQAYKNEAFVQSRMSLSTPAEQVENKLTKSAEMIGGDIKIELQIISKQDNIQVETKNRRNSVLSSIAGSSGKNSLMCSNEMLPHCVPEGVISFRNSNEVVNMAEFMKQSDADHGELLNNIRPRSVSNYESSINTKRNLESRQNSLPRGHQSANKDIQKNFCLNMALENTLLKNTTQHRRNSNQLVLNANELAELKEIEDTADLPYMEDIDKIVEPLPVVQQRSMLYAFLRTNFKPIFILISASMAAYAFLFIAVLTVIIDYAADHGVLPHQGKFLVIAFSVTDLIGRLSFGQVIDRKLVTMKTYAGLTISIMGVCVSVIPMHYSFEYMLSCMSVYGLVQGGTAIMWPILVTNYMERDEESIAMGCLNFYGGLLMLPMAPMVGYFRDTIGSYNGMFYIVGGLCVFVGFFWQMEPYIVNRGKKQSKANSK